MMKNLFEDHVPLLRPWLGEEEIREIRDVVLSGWISQGPKVLEFENAVAEYVGAKYGVATNSCTSSLHLAARLSGLGSGDEVICPSFTCMATANAIHHTGALPVFAEIELTGEVRKPGVHRLYRFFEFQFIPLTGYGPDNSPDNGVIYELARKR